MSRAKQILKVNESKEQTWYDSLSSGDKDLLYAAFDQVDGKKGIKKVKVGDLGTAEVWLGEHPEGTDRGGYIPYMKINVKDVGTVDLSYDEVEDEIVII